MLDNISVFDSDLIDVAPAVSSLLFDEQTSFEDVISEVKTAVYGMIKEDYKANNGLYTNDELDAIMDLVKDYDREKYLKRKIVRMAIAEAYRQNENEIQMATWDAEALKIPLIYYIDEDSDDVVDSGEERTTPRFPTLGR